MSGFLIICHAFVMNLTVLNKFMGGKFNERLSELVIE